MISLLGTSSREGDFTCATGLRDGFRKLVGVWEGSNDGQCKIVCCIDESGDTYSSTLPESTRSMLS